MGVEKYDRVYRIGGPLAGSLPNQCRIWKNIDGYRNAPFLRNTDQVWKPLNVIIRLRKAAILQRGLQHALHGDSWFGAENTWSGQMGFGSMSYYDISPSSTCGISSSDWSATANRARSRFLGKVSSKSRAEMGTTITETNKSVSMIVKRYGTLNHAYTTLIGNTLASAAKCARILQCQRPSRKKILAYQKMGDVGGLWLEYWMGWAPLLGDIHNALAVLTEGFGISVPKIVSGAARLMKRHTYSVSAGNRFSTGLVEYKVYIRGSVLGVNPNMRLRRDLGLTNPFRTIHDIIPWSWLIGWTHNLTEVIGQLDDLYGVDLEPNSIAKTEIARWRGTRHFRSYASAPWDVGSMYDFNMCRGRYATLPAVKFRFIVPALKDTRMLTLASLFSKYLSKYRYVTVY